MPHFHSFQSAHRRAEKVSATVIQSSLQKVFANHRSFDRASLRRDKQGCDLWAVQNPDGKSIPVDLKVLRDDPRDKYGRDEVLIEIASNISRGTPGWANDPDRITGLHLVIYGKKRELALPAWALRQTLSKQEANWCRKYPVKLVPTPDERGLILFYGKVLILPRHVLESAMAEFLPRDWTYRYLAAA